MIQELELRKQGKPKGVGGSEYKGRWEKVQEKVE